MKQGRKQCTCLDNFLCCNLHPERDFRHNLCHRGRGRDWCRTYNGFFCPCHKVCCMLTSLTTGSIFHLEQLKLYKNKVVVDTDFAIEQTPEIQRGWKTGFYRENSFSLYLWQEPSSALVLSKSREVWSTPFSLSTAVVATVIWQKLMHFLFARTEKRDRICTYALDML